MSSPQWRFADFRLDPANACLWRGTQPIALTLKAFDVLQYLVTHPDRLVTKDTLLVAIRFYPGACPVLSGGAPSVPAGKNRDPGAGRGSAGAGHGARIWALLGP